MTDTIIDTFNAEIKNQGELGIERDSYINNQRAGALVFENSTAHERVQLTHRSGANLKLDNRSFSFFSPNTYQGLIHGKSFLTVANDSFETTYKNAEKRALGDFTIITGSKNFFNDSIAQEYIDTYRDVAVLKATPELKIPAVGNNSAVQHKGDGTPSEGSGAVEGGTWTKTPAVENAQDLVKEKTKRLTELEMQMGKGGSIKLMAAKQLFFQAGTAAVNYDSGVIIPEGREITQGYKKKDPKEGGQEEVKTTTTTYQSVDTSSAMPFGDITFNAMGKFNLIAGSGGFDFKSTGNSAITSTGRTSIAGAEVLIGGNSEASKTGRVAINSTTDVFIKSGFTACITSPGIVLNAVASVSLDTPYVHITADETYIEGNLHVHGNLLVNGDIECNGDTGITVTTGDVTIPVGDCVAQGVSLVHHTHPGDGSDGPPGETGEPF